MKFEMAFLESGKSELNKYIPKTMQIKKLSTGLFNA